MYMGNIEKYYENTKDALPHENIKEFIRINNKQGKAIDLGCGTGRDTVFLVKNNWNVLAIDREDTNEIISNKLNTEEMNRFRFSSQTFEEIKLQENNLIVANFSIPFGTKDSWANIKDKIVFLTKEQVLGLLESFEILKFEEIEKDGKTGLGEIKHWHIFEIIAKKK